MIDDSKEIVMREKERIFAIRHPEKRDMIDNEEGTLFTNTQTRKTYILKKLVWWEEI